MEASHRLPGTVALIWIWLDFGLILVGFCFGFGATEVAEVTRSYKVHKRLADRSSSFLGVNVGLARVLNLSKSGLRPDEEDPGRLKGAQECESHRSSKKLQTRACTRDFLGPPQELLGALLEPKSSRIESKSSRIEAKSKPNPNQIESKSKSES